MPSSTTPEPRPCPIAAGLEVLGDRWTLLVLREVLYGSHRFEEILKFTGAPRDVLTRRLAMLVERGLLDRRALIEGGRRQGYYLTPSGRDVRPVLLALGAFGEHHMTGAYEHWRDLVLADDEA